MLLVGKGGGGVVAVVMCGVVEGREEREKGFEVYILKIEMNGESPVEIGRLNLPPTSKGSISPSIHPSQGANTRGKKYRPLPSKQAVQHVLTLV